jgi:hypothetical protein
MTKSAPARKPLTESQKADRRDPTDGRGHPNKTRNTQRRQETARRARVRTGTSASAICSAREKKHRV